MSQHPFPSELSGSRYPPIQPNGKPPSQWTSAPKRNRGRHRESKPNVDKPPRDKRHHPQQVQPTLPSLIQPEANFIHGQDFPSFEFDPTFTTLSTASGYRPTGSVDGQFNQNILQMQPAVSQNRPQPPMARQRSGNTLPNILTSAQATPDHRIEPGSISESEAGHAFCGSASGSPSPGQTEPMSVPSKSGSQTQPPGFEAKTKEDLDKLFKKVQILEDQARHLERQTKHLERQTRHLERQTNVMEGRVENTETEIRSVLFGS